jgi:protein arginine kinase activator
MKCQHCEKPATFHITELTGPEGTAPTEFHLCEVHAKLYLMQPETGGQQPPTLAGALAQQLSVNQTAEELAKLDQRACPVCGITFYEFRNQGRLGCPHDYVFFEQELEPLIVNIHGATQHTGKRPKTGARGTDQQTEKIRLKREMEEAISREDYETASKLRDEIRRIERDVTEVAETKPAREKKKKPRPEGPSEEKA